jgi:hypothetical protein
LGEIPGVVAIVAATVLPAKTSAIMSDRLMSMISDRDAAAAMD